MTTTATTQLPHRRQSFTTLRDDDVHRLAGSVLGAVAADDARIERPEPGVDNRTYLIRTDDGGPGGGAIKMRPQSPRTVPAARCGHGIYAAVLRSDPQP